MNAMDVQVHAQLVRFLYICIEVITVATACGTYAHTLLTASQCRTMSVFKVHFVFTGQCSVFEIQKESVRHVVGKKEVLYCTASIFWMKIVKGHQNMENVTQTFHVYGFMQSCGSMYFDCDRATVVSY